MKMYEIENQGKFLGLESLSDNIETHCCKGVSLTVTLTYTSNIILMNHGAFLAYSKAHIGLLYFVIGLPSQTVRLQFLFTITNS